MYIDNYCIPCYASSSIQHFRDVLYVWIILTIKTLSLNFVFSISEMFYGYDCNGDIGAELLAEY